MARVRRHPGTADSSRTLAPGPIHEAHPPGATRRPRSARAGFHSAYPVIICTATTSLCTASRAIHQTLGLTLTLTCGDAGRVGKTSLVLRYVQNTFNDAQPATIQASYLTKRLTVENKTINLAIWVRGASLSSPLRCLCVSGWSCATQCRVWPYMHPPDTYASPPAINLFPRGFVHPVR